MRFHHSIEWGENFMTLQEFIGCINGSNPRDIANECLCRELVHAIPDELMYRSYVDAIRDDYPNSTRVAIMGSGNWKFSLNPKKNFREYCDTSDIDIAIVCPLSFDAAWRELRSYHRNNYYLLGRRDQDNLRRNGENVYSGFISPKWIPGKSKSKLAYLLNSNKYSNVLVGYREVNMMYFRDDDEAIDYYVRGFRLVKK